MKKNVPECNKSPSYCVIKVEITPKKLPMQNFTPEEMKPSEHVLNMIRQIAYTYRVLNINGKNEAYCLN